MTRRGKIKVLHLIDHHRIGGPGKTILNSARYINTERFEIHAASFCSGETDFSRAVEAGCIPHLCLPDRRGVDWAHFTDLRKYLKNARIKILHTHCFKSDFLGAAQKRFNPGIVLVTTHHGWIRNSIKQSLYVNASMFLSRFFDGLELVSESMRGDLPLSVRRSGRVRVIHNAIVLQDYVSCGPGDMIRKGLGVGNGEMLIGVIGRLSEEKGCREMLAACRELRKEDETLKLVFVGDGPLRADLERTAGRLGLAGHVIFTGYREPVKPLYGAIDVLVCPSRTEGLSNVILEAMACRVPVIAADVGGNSEIVNDGFNGVLIKKATAGALLPPLRKLARDTSFRMNIVESAFETVRDKFSFAARMRKEEEFYEALLDTAHSRADMAEPPGAGRLIGGK